MPPLRLTQEDPADNGEPVIPNGPALRKPHHAAFDRYLIGVTPDLEDLTGQGRRIHVPRADHLEPNRDFLAERYALFPRAS